MICRLNSPVASSTTAVGRTRLHCDADAVVSNVSEVIQSGLPSFWFQILSSICWLQNLWTQILKNNIWFSLYRPISLIASPAADDCHVNKENWYPVISKFISYLTEGWRLLVDFDFVYQKLLILTNICWSHLKILYGLVFLNCSVCDTEYCYCDTTCH